MTVVARIKVDKKRVAKALREFSGVFNKRELLAAIGARHLKWVNDNFQAQGLETRWNPLSANTRAARGGDARPLQDKGILRGSFHKIQSGESVSVGSPSKIAEYQHHGTDPYVIRPRRKKSLLFQVAGGGQRIAGRAGNFRFAKEIHHPGLPARPLLPSNRAGEKLADAVINAAIELAIRRNDLGKR